MKGKGKQEAKVAVQNGKRRRSNFLKNSESQKTNNFLFREEIEEEDDEDDEDFKEEDISEDEWEEDDSTEGLMAKWHTKEELEELEILSSEGYMQLLKSGLLGKLPPYFLQTKEQKQVFFNKLNKSYYSKLENQAARVLDHSRKVKFQLAKNIVKGNPLQ
ncbi:MAG TPA: hypothetical protein PLS50_03585 [Candidatus Dojkabacteria bacterium]|nr:hypothetical protein [Candidatus Dojkabacteria bacterium]